MAAESGGKAVYGAAVGILMLETRFPRIPGDMGNAQTWPFPVLYRVVRGATPDRVVRRSAEGLRDAFVAAGRELVADGADGITTDCGFLSVFQDELAEALGVPVASSALLQVELIERTLRKGRRCGILTIDSASLTPAHLEKAGVPADTPVVGTEGGRELTRVILENEPTLDPGLASVDLMEAARRLIHGRPEVAAILLECPSMTAYAADIRRRLGLPVFSTESFIRWFQAGLMPRRFDWGLDDPRP